MKRIILLLSFTLLMLLPISALGKDNKSFFALKPGVYFFKGDLKDEHPMGFYGEIVYGYNLHPKFVLESGIGYFHDGVSQGNDVRGNFITFAAKGVYPIKNFKPFIGGGLGIYFTQYKGKLNGVPVDDRDNVYGGHLLFGADYNIVSTIFIGIEGKYILTEKAEYNGIKANLNGLATIMRLGLRF